ncbi:MAG: peptide chain release factor 2 [Oscillospiraceae bacterium]|jgi:peptide chain release factor 2|nr:peptide chain release factor 2 [Oscillospiraceae bacterium]
MLQYEELRLRLLGYREKLNELREALGLEAMREEIARREAECARDGFWDDPKESQVVLQRISKLKGKCESYEKLAGQFEDALTMIELANEEEDEGLYEECLGGVDTFSAALDAMTLSTLLSGEYDANSAILAFHAGAGGTEAQDWNEMLVRMYTRWSERHGFKCSLVDFLDGEEAGLKSAVLTIEGENAYGYLKSENGVHRLVRCSPFDSSGRRHTSFASLEVMPEIDDNVAVDINPDDIKMDVYRASGAGGQKVNKTSSAVRLTHIPTGIVTSCQVERSQHQNREVALRMLKSKLLEIKEREHLDKIDDIKGVQMEIAWGSQIRSYVFMPYQLAKDHRTNYENGNIPAVMDGDLDGFINAYLKMQANANA